MIARDFYNPMIWEIGYALYRTEPIIRAAIQKRAKVVNPGQRREEIQELIMLAGSTTLSAPAIVQDIEERRQLIRSWLTVLRVEPAQLGVMEG